MTQSIILSITQSKDSVMTKFKYASLVQSPLQKNKQHQFAMSHALQLFKANAVYSFIPKNGCSTLRLSVAVANGCIEGIEQGHWIHQNNHTFNPTLAEAAKSTYQFVILRCPFRRLASVFLDKFVAKEPPAWAYRDLLERRIELDDLTFTDFVLSLRQSQVFKSDIHWRPQVDFLLYENYSDYFALENFPKVKKTLKEKINLDIVDARSLTEHGITGLTLLEEQDYSHMSAFDIAVLKRKGLCPHPGKLYTPELIDIVKSLYADDFSLYTAKCNSNDLLFPV